MNLSAPPLRAQRAAQASGSALNEDVALASPSAADKQTLVPSVVSLAQRLLPTAKERLGQHDKEMDVQYDDDFEGVRSPLGSPTMAPKKLKTTGLDESDYRDGCHDLEEDHAEAGDAMANEEEITEYLPQSAAMLMSALQGSAPIGGYEGKGRISFDSLPNLVDDVSAAPKDETPSRSNDAAGWFVGSPPLWRLQSMEKEADALLDAIRRDEIGTGSPQGSNLRLRRYPPAAISGGSEDLITSVRSDDDDGSIGGDMARLSISIAHLQRDLESVDFSHLSNTHDDDFGGLEGDMNGYENGTLARLKLWFSRGMIMEQKLLHTYVSPSDGASNGGSATQSSGRYVDNPVLIWSLALMWAFVVPILMNPKIAELVEGGEPGHLADIIQWLFG